MKTRFITLILLLMATLFVAEANPVDKQTAHEVAVKFVNDNTTVSLKSAEELQWVTTYNTSSDDAAFYVFNTPNGFVIVSAVDCASPILGYSDEGRLFDTNNVPVQLQDILQGYTEQIQYAIENNLQPDKLTAQQWRLVKINGKLSENRERTQVGPLLTTIWDQGQYYNALCPADAGGPDGHCVTGCVATAMAQIIRFHEYPQHGRGSHGYRNHHGNSYLSMNFEESNYDYNNMPDQLSSTSSAAEINAVAKLMVDCGIAANMGYTNQSSGAFNEDAHSALVNFFKYNPNLSRAWKDKFTTDEWHTMLRNELDANRPIYYEGKIDCPGHAFVCDGYTDNDFFHFNFGWSGVFNGMYLTGAINIPGGHTYNVDQSAILGIYPDNTGNVILAQEGSSVFTLDGFFDFYNQAGHNSYYVGLINDCYDTITILPSDPQAQLVVNFIYFDDYTINVYDGVNTNTLLRSLNTYDICNMTPVVSTNHGIKIIAESRGFNPGFKLNITQENDCRSVSNVIHYVNTSEVHLEWVENGSATQWEIEYGIKGFELGNGTTMTVDNTSVDITGLTQYVEYDFYIRPVCGGCWFGPVTLTPDLPYWTDIVTTQPAGYVVHPNGEIHITSAEGLAWLSICTNGFNGQLQNDYQNKIIKLETDLDLGQYKWKPIGSAKNAFCGYFDGCGHSINNLYINETSTEIGLFGRISSLATIVNLTLINSNVTGKSFVAALCGEVNGYSNQGSVVFDNCHVLASTVHGGYGVGTLCSNFLVASNTYEIRNCSSSGNVYGYELVGGLIGRTKRVRLANCFSSCNVHNVNNNYSHWYKGGLVGYVVGDNVLNSYAVGHVEKALLDYNGQVVGVLDNSSAEFIYGICGVNQLPLVDSLLESTMSSYATISLNNDIVDLSSNVTIGGKEYSDLLSALNAWVDANNTEGYYRYWVADTENVNGGYPVFAEISHIFQTEGNWNVAANWNTNTVPSTSNNVVIAANVSIPTDFVANTKNVFVQTGNALTIEDGGQLIHSNNVNATMKRTANGYGGSKGGSGWYTIASPVDGASLALVTSGSGNHDLYRYDETNMKWLNAKNPENISLFSNLSRGIGYLYANEETQTLNISGEMIGTGTTVTIPLTYTCANETYKGINLVGNPFTCNVSDNVTVGGTDLTSYYYVSNGSELASALLSERPIQPCEGFLVKATAASQDLVFNPTSKGETDYKPAYIRIEAGNDAFMDRAYVLVGNSNTLPKVTINEQVAHVSVYYNQADYAVASVARAKEEIPVNFKAAHDGNYSISVNTIGLDMDYLHLIDKLTGNDIDLLAMPEYTFSAKSGDGENRFRLVFEANGNALVTSNEPFAYFNGSEWVIDGPSTGSGACVLQVIDVMGRMLRSESVSGNATMHLPELGAGVYVLRLVNGESVRTQKIVID